MHIAIRTGWIMGSLLVAGLASAAGNAPPAFEAEMKRIVAERQIFEVISRYSHMWDSKNPSGLADLFTEDGVWDRWGPGVQKPDISLKGREALREYTAERFRTNLADRQPEPGQRLIRSRLRFPPCSWSRPPLSDPAPR